MADWNLIRALISQAPLNELYQVKDIVEKEIQWSRDNMLKASAVQNVEQYNKNTDRVVPRYVSPEEQAMSNLAGLAAQVDPNYKRDSKLQGGVRGTDPVDGAYPNETTDKYEPDQYKTTANYKDPSKLHISESGATSSHVPLRYDLIPRSLLERAAERYTMGISIHGERGYQKGLGDRGFIINRINHIYEHLNTLFHPDYRKANSPEDEEGIDIKSIHANLGAVLWGVGFICEVAEHVTGRQILNELRAEGRIKTHSD